MRIRLKAGPAERSYDAQLGRFTDPETVPCFRCGVCCQRWQPLIGQVEADRLARFLGLSTPEFLQTYARPYPFDDAFQLNEANGACVFLRWQDGKAACCVHEARPQACRDWDASLKRKECLDGLIAQAGEANLLVHLPDFDDPNDAEAFNHHLHGEVAITYSSAEALLPSR